MNDLSTQSLQSLRVECREVIESVCDRIAVDPQLVNDVRSLVAAPELLDRFNDLVKSQPESAGIILQAAIATLANSQSIIAIDHELNRRAMSN